MQRQTERGHTPTHNICNSDIPDRLSFSEAGEDHHKANAAAYIRLRLSRLEETSIVIEQNSLLSSRRGNYFIKNIGLEAAGDLS